MKKNYKPKTISFWQDYDNNATIKPYDQVSPNSIGDLKEFFYGKENAWYGSFKEGGGIHQPMYTSPYIEEYSKKYGSNKMLNRLEKDLNTLLKEKDLIPFELSHIIMYIYIFIRDYKKENELSFQGVIKNRLKLLIKERLSEMVKKYGNEDTHLDYAKNKNNHGYFLHSAQIAINKIKERYGVDLLGVNY